MSDKSVAIFANNLYFSYTKSDQILNEINLYVNKSTVFALLGPSGLA